MTLARSAAVALGAATLAVVVVSACLGQGAGGQAAAVDPVMRGVAGQTGLPLTAGGVARPGNTLQPSQFPGSPRRLPGCRIDDVPATHTEPSDWASTIVDTRLALPADYRPPDLVLVSDAGLAGSGRVRAIIADDLRAMAASAADDGRPLAVQSAYRSFDRQATVFAGWVASSGYDEAVRFSARPGHSEHQLGTAVDLREANGPAPWLVSFGDRPTGRWLLKHAWEFGFIESYPAGAEDVTCYGAEAWHYRYVGRAVAADVHRSGLTLREWLWQHAGG
jgi:D-alanyl-D-alanine carboxypeptidase